MATGTDDEAVVSSFVDSAMAVADDKFRLATLRSFVVAHASVFAPACRLCAVSQQSAQQLVVLRHKARAAEEAEPADRQAEKRRAERTALRAAAHKRVWSLYDRLEDREKKRLRVTDREQLEQRLDFARLDDEVLGSVATAQTFAGALCQMGVEAPKLPPAATPVLSPAAVREAYKWSERAKKAPSSVAGDIGLLESPQGAENTVLFCHRPAGTSGGIPAVLLSQELRAFAEMCVSALPDKDDCQVVQDLVSTMPNFCCGPGGKARRADGFRAAFRPLMDHLGMTNFDPYTIDGSKTDGSVVGGGSPLAMLANLVVMPDTGKVSLNLLPIPDAMLRAARFVHALKLTLPMLMTHYSNVIDSISTTSPLVQYYPYVVHFQSESEATIRFKYTEQLQAKKLLFRAEVVGAGGDLTVPKQLAIKFVRRYGKEAHILLSGHQMAPKLLYEGALGEHGDGWRVVVMEWCEELLEFDKAVAAGGTVFRDSLLEVLQLLRANNLVHGDLRYPNIFGRTCGEKMAAFIVDFDWAGKAEIDSGKMNDEMKLWEDALWEEMQSRLSKKNMKLPSLGASEAVLSTLFHELGFEEEFVVRALCVLFRHRMNTVVFDTTSAECVLKSIEAWMASKNLPSHLRPKTDRRVPNNGDEEMPLQYLALRALATY
eukprot:m51a1_g1879 hypothetical protein (657) ;mRNA; r:685532-689561